MTYQLYIKKGALPHVHAAQILSYSEEKYAFFNAIFNVADSAITVGMGLIILFQKSFFG